MDHPAAALSLVFAFSGALVVDVDHIDLVIKEQDCICPLSDQWSNLLGGLHFPVIIGAHFLRELHLPELSMGCHHDMDSALRYFCQKVQQFSEPLRAVGIAFAIPEVLDAVLLVGFQKIINLHLLRPVRCVEDQRLAKCRIVPDKPDFIQEHLP